MDFNSYLTSTNRTLREAEAETGIGYDLLRKYKNGERRPRIGNMLAIKKWTNGEVNPEDWYLPANDNESLPPDGVA